MCLRGMQGVFRMSVHKRPLWDDIKKKKTGYLLLLPTLLLLLFFAYYPFLVAIIRAFYQWDGFQAPQFIGLENFRRLFLEDYIFRISVRNMAIIVGTGLLKVTVVPFITARVIFTLLDRRMAYVYRTALVIPLVVPWIVNLLIWSSFYSPEVGVINQFLRLIGLEAWTRSWLADIHLAIWAVIFVGFPWAGGIAVLIFLAGFQAIPDSILDASEIDGAKGLRRIIFVELPFLVGQFRVIMVLTIIALVKEYAGILILTGGGPGAATLVPGLYLYLNAFSYSQFGYGSAIGVTLSVLIFVLTYINMRYMRSPVEHQA